MIILSLPLSVSASLCLCSRYFNTWQHTDNTIAYYVGATEASEKEKKCASLRHNINLLTVVSVDCYEGDYAHFLCEVPSVVSDDVNNTASHVTVSENIHFTASPSFTRSDFPFKVTSCPDGHLTHEMFACDVPSACWVDAVTTPRSCRSSLQPLPPSFTCSTGQDDVPYTLVCDHRPDCKDSSDESFCDFLPCDPITNFDCGEREVHSPLVFLGFYHSVHPSPCPSACLLACLPWSLFVRLPVYSFVFLGICQSI